MTTVKQKVKGMPTTDGAGVQLTRVIGQPAMMDLNPFLLLDCFESDDPNAYIAGFPSHPHRGFQTITYMLDGQMRHKDNHGHEGLIQGGGVQWMNAGRGIIHSEMPEQSEGLLKGFQFWLNLPAKQKMSQPHYDEVPAQEIPVVTQGQHRIKVISNHLDKAMPSAIETLYPATMLHVFVGGESAVQLTTVPGNTAFVYVIKGAITIDGVSLQEYELASLEPSELASFQGAAGSEFLFIAAKPIDEPIARHGPFVMNTHQELIQAFQDYQNGQF